MAENTEVVHSPSPTRPGLRVGLLVFGAGLLFGLAAVILVLSGWPGSGALDRVLPGNAEPTPVRSVSELAAPASGGSQGLTGAPPRVGQEAPDFSLPDLNGKLVKLSELRGQPVLINFWATWCIPCKQEMPAIDAAYQAHKDQGFTVLAIEIEEPADEVTQYVQDLKLTFTPLLDRDPRVFDRYGVRAMPSSFFIDRQGKVSAVHFGPLTNQQLEDNLQAILAGPGG